MASFINNVWFINNFFKDMDLSIFRPSNVSVKKVSDEYICTVLGYFVWKMFSVGIFLYQLMKCSVNESWTYVEMTT